MTSLWQRVKPGVPYAALATLFASVLVGASGTTTSIAGRAARRHRTTGLCRRAPPSPSGGASSSGR